MPYHGGRRTNWIATYKFITALALQFRENYYSLPSNIPRPYGLADDSFDYIVDIIQDDIEFDSVHYQKTTATTCDLDWDDDLILGLCDYNTLLNQENYQAVARLKSFFVYGIALHDLSDTFAHAAYMDYNGVRCQIIHKYPPDDPEDLRFIEENYIDGADNRERAEFRWVDCKYAAEKLIDHAIGAEVGLVLDFAPHVLNTPRGYYLHRIVDKAWAILNSSNYVNAFTSIDHDSDYFNND